MKIAVDGIKLKEEELTSHSLLTTSVIQSLDDLKIFMEHHVYAVWDFMSLTKALQKRICPSTDVWLPVKHTRDESARLINEIILGEESDRDLGGGSISHYDLYLQAMEEIGADTEPVTRFLRVVETEGVDFALNNCPWVPEMCLDFMKTTFEFIKTDKKHIIASAFTYGREDIIPDMFKGILTQLQINSHGANKFYYYLERHIEIDGGEHGPAARKLVENMCGVQPSAYVEAEKAALKALDARIKLWTELEDKHYDLFKQSEIIISNYK